MPVRVVVDAMGGDHAPGVVIEGAVAAARAWGIAVVLAGPEETVRAELGAHDTGGLSLEVMDAPEVIGMDESPATALKQKPRSSIHRGLTAVKAGDADAFASAGNTGAVMAAALFILGRLPGVLRPALPAYFPTPGAARVVVDVGANIDCRSEQLVQFARMGRVLVQCTLEAEDPTVALLNIGEEAGKGTEAVKEAYDILDEAPDLRFLGNVEGRDLLREGADVIVCDGFVGNIILKMGESVAAVLPEMIRREVARQGLDEDRTAEVVGAVMRGALERFDYDNFGGAPLLGVDGLAVIGHGSASSRAVSEMVRRTAELARADMPRRIAEAINPQAPSLTGGAASAPQATAPNRA